MTMCHQTCPRGLKALPVVSTETLDLRLRHCKISTLQLSTTCQTSTSLECLIQTSIWSLLTNVCKVTWTCLFPPICSDSLCRLPLESAPAANSATKTDSNAGHDKVLPVVGVNNRNQISEGNPRKCALLSTDIRTGHEKSLADSLAAGDCGTLNIPELCMPKRWDCCWLLPHFLASLFAGNSLASYIYVCYHPGGEMRTGQRNRTKNCRPSTNALHLAPVRVKTISSPFAFTPSCCKTGQMGQRKSVYPSKTKFQRCPSAKWDPLPFKSGRPSSRAARHDAMTAIGHVKDGRYLIPLKMAILGSARCKESRSIVGRHAADLRSPSPP